MRKNKLLIYCLLVSISVLMAPLSRATEDQIDLDGNPFNGAESTVETNVLQSFPVEVENVIFNNVPGTSFVFGWPGAGPGGFDSILTLGPDVGTKWTWSTVSQVYTILTPATFQPERTIQVFGQPPSGVSGPGDDDQTFTVTGKSIAPTQVTLNSATLTASLVTFFSPEDIVATCESNFVPGRFEQVFTNLLEESVFYTVGEIDPCCQQAQMTICEDGCQFYLTDNNNCGGCGVTCGANETCDLGQCVCDPGFGDCDGVCEDILNDEANCGGCSISCVPGQTCDLGQCVCDPGFDVCGGECKDILNFNVCDGVCEDILNDEANCGGCGNACLPDQTCDQGQCVCDPGFQVCGAVCEDILNDEANCGDCGLTCNFDQTCEQGVCTDICPDVNSEFCQQMCVNTLVSEDHCGACDTPCPAAQVCDQGMCACEFGFDFCDPFCVDTLTDEANCGSCGVTCPAAQTCEQGACVCAPGLDFCDPFCVDTLTDEANCGGCGMACAAGQTCEQGACVCPPGQDFCDGACIDVLNDMQNCGGCGIACVNDEESCRQGICVCDDDGECDDDSSAARITARPVPFGEQGATRVFAGTIGKMGFSTFTEPRDSPARSGTKRPGVRSGRVASTRGGAADERIGARTTRVTRGGREGIRVVQVVRASSGVSFGNLNVEEAPVCGIPPIEIEILPGESFTLCQTGAVVGKEIFTTAGIGDLGQGPCALIVPDVDAPTNMAVPSTKSVRIIDESGDSLLQSGEQAELFIELLNLGEVSLLNPIGVLSSPPDSRNPEQITFLSDTSAFGDLPLLGTPADCDTDPVFEPRTNLTSYEVIVPAQQEGGVGRPFNLNLQGDANGPVSLDVTIVLGFAESCDPATRDLEAYDGLEGFLTPADVKLLPKNYPPNVAAGTFNHGSNIPLKLKLRCGSQLLRGSDLELSPQIVGITHDAAGELPLTAINVTTSNPDNPFFDCGQSRCEFGLRTAGFPTDGVITVRVRMPDSRVFHASFRLTP